MLLIPSISNAEVNNQNKFAALAVDRNNGFAYGFAYDNPKSTIAEKKALEECNLRSKNNNCSIVLSWSGEGCGVYRSIDENVGTAYGWGIANLSTIDDDHNRVNNYVLGISLGYKFDL